MFSPLDRVRDPRSSAALLESLLMCLVNAQIHPTVAAFFNLNRERIILRYCHLHPSVSEELLGKYLDYRPKHFHWAGSDLFTVTNAQGTRQSIIIETNSCPSGQKSMPLLQDTEEYGGYKKVIDQFVRMQQIVPKKWGGLAVIWDKNQMEASGYAAVMADLCNEQVYMTPYYDNDADPPVKWVDGIMHVRTADHEWHPIRACFRYVTNAPWKRIPVRTKTLVMNEIVSCLAGGRNKMMAHRAYELFNAELAGTGLHIKVPETYTNVPKPDIPLRVQLWGGHAVLKVPYSNAGQGVYTITNSDELDSFMSTDHHYDKFLVQSLVGNASWSSVGREGLQYHIGNIPDKKGRTYVSDLRVMVIASDEEGPGGGFSPVAIYARRARKPLARHLKDGAESSWDMLGTNLSVKMEDGSFTTDTNRLLLMDRKDFNALGISIDDLIESYISTVLSVIAIDKMACLLVDDKGRFDMELFSALNPDDVLCAEILK